MQMQFHRMSQALLKFRSALLRSQMRSNQELSIVASEGFLWQGCELLMPPSKVSKIARCIVEFKNTPDPFIVTVLNEAIFAYTKG